MRFWDTSAVVSLLTTEVSSWKAWDLFRQDPDMAFWWATPTECLSTLARFEREPLEGFRVLPYVDEVHEPSADYRGHTLASVLSDRAISD